MKRTSDAAYLRYILAGAIIFIIFILQYSGPIPLTMGRMTAVLVVPCVIYCAMYMREIGGSVLGLIMGVFLDCVVARAVCFNAIFLMAAGCICSLMGRYVMNRNTRSALLLSSVGTALYFFLKWLIFTAFSSPGAGAILWHYVVPSFFYTVILSIPFYFLFSALLRQKIGEVNRI